MKLATGFEKKKFLSLKNISGFSSGDTNIQVLKYPVWGKRTFKNSFPIFFEEVFRN